MNEIYNADFSNPKSPDFPFHYKDGPETINNSHSKDNSSNITHKHLSEFTNENESFLNHLANIEFGRSAVKSYSFQLEQNGTSKYFDNYVALIIF